MCLDVCRIYGRENWLSVLQKSTLLVLMLLGVFIIFLIFYFKVFPKLVRKHEIRIRNYKKDRVEF